MVKTAAELYDALLAFSGQSETSICNLHRPCSDHHLCSTPSFTRVIDFDRVERQIATGCRSSLPSSDGVALNANQSVFCFIEIKGWDIFISRNVADTSAPSDEERARIDAQAYSFNLKGKLQQSMADCETITGQSDLFTIVSYAYIIVTDINSDSDALADFASNLSSLAETASVWTYCDRKMIEIVDRVNLPVKKVYSHCRDFDAVISKINT